MRCSARTSDQRTRVVERQDCGLKLSKRLVIRMRRPLPCRSGRDADIGGGLRVGGGVTGRQQDIIGERYIDVDGSFGGALTSSAIFHHTDSMGISNQAEDDDSQKPADEPASYMSRALCAFPPFIHKNCPSLSHKFINETAGLGRAKMRPGGGRLCSNPQYALSLCLRS